MTLRQRIRFYQQLAVLVRAGVPMRSSLLRLQERISGREMAVLTQQVNSGERLAEAFAAAGFSPFECHLVTAGERSAQLEAVFEHLSNFWARQLEMRLALFRPLYYPIAVLHLALIVGAVVESVTVSSTAAVVHLILRVAFLYAGAFVAWVLVRVTWGSEEGQRFWLAIPIIGSSLSAACAYRWITALKLEYAAGIPMPSAVGDAWRASGYQGSKRLAEEGELSLREGSELSMLVQRWKQLPRDWVDFIETGEVSGALETAFANLEAEASRAWTLAQERMTEWLPKITYFIVLIIAAIQVGLLVYQTVVAPMSNAENAIDNAINGK